MSQAAGLGWTFDQAGRPDLDFAAPQTAGEQLKRKIDTTRPDVVINAAAYTYTSVAIHDALKMLDIPIIEVHISDPKTREGFRHTSYIEPLASQVIAGKGVDGYLQALEILSEL